MHKRTAAIILAASLALTAGAAYAATWIEAEVDFVDTVPNHPGLAPYRALLEELEGVRFVAVYQAHDPAHGDSLRGESFDALIAEQGAFTQALLAEFPGQFSHSLSVWEGMRTGNYMLAKIATGGNPPSSSYSVPSDPVTYEAVKSQLLGDDTLDDVLAQDGSSAISLFFTKENDRGLALEVEAFLQTWAAREPHPATTDHQVSGLLYSSAYTDQKNREETQFWAPISAAGVFLALLFAVRRVGNVLIAMISVVVGLVWTYGLMGVLGIRISFLTLFLSPIIVGVGIDYAVHLLHRYEEARATQSKHEAIRTALRTTGRAVAVAAATTVAGLAMLLLVPSPLFSEIGGVSAVGVAFGFVAALTITPALRRLLPAAKRTPRRDWLGPKLAAFAARSRSKGWMAVALVTVVAIGVASQTTIESGSAENEFPQDDPVIQLQQRIEDEYGAFQRAYLVFQGDIPDPEVLTTIHGAITQSESVPLFREASAVTTLLVADADTDQGAIDIAMNGLLGGLGQEPGDAEKLPQTREEAIAALDRLFEDPLWRGIAPFTISRDYDLAVVAITIDPWEDQASLRSLRDALADLAAELQPALGDKATVAASGAPMNRAAIIDQTPWDISIATIGSAFAVFTVLAMAWHRKPHGVRMAAAAAGMVLLAAVWLLASVVGLDWVYGASGSGNNAALNDMFLLAFAITVAVGVDDFVHVVSRYWESGTQQEAWTHAGRAITGTTLTTLVAFGLMSGVYFLQSKNLAILTSLGVLYAYALTLLLVPRLLPKDSNTGSAHPES
ncbi:MAG: efflux RND transporter permease subunit [Thermoplasmatota archaeon]